LQASLDDASPQVRLETLRVLVHAGDPTATDRALSYLGGAVDRLQDALNVMRTLLPDDPELARRAWEILQARHAREDHRRVQDRTATLKAMGVVPLEEATVFLLEQAEAARGETIEGLRGFRWLLLQASNTGPAGRRLLRSRLASIEDPLERLDVIWAMGTGRDDDAREALLEVTDGAAKSPYEVLFAADLLTRLGTTALLAPRLKRVAYAMEDRDVRRGLNCLLWRNY
jgi:hypothetical protein